MKAGSQSLPGQLLMLRLAEPRWSSALERRLRALAPGGILLAGPLARSPASLCELLSRISRSLPVAPFLAIREEGGARGPLAVLLPPLPPPRAMAGRGVVATGQMGELIGEALSLLGFNTNFAPLLDLATPFTEKTLGERAFGSDPKRVAESGRVFLRGLRRHKILGCGKHFPGWGSVPPATTHELPQSGKPMAGLWREDLVPFRELLPQLPMLLLSNAAYKAYDFDHPRAGALSSQVVEGLLRAKVGYRGLALACDLESDAVRGALSLGEAAVRAINVGCDMVIVEKQESWLTMQQALVGALEAGKLPCDRLEQALERIRAAKRGLRPPRGQLSKIAWDRLARRFEEFACGA